MVSEQALQVQEDNEARQRVGGRTSPQHQLHLPLLTRDARAVGQRSPNAPEQLHERFWPLVSKPPPPPPGRDAQASHDVSASPTACWVHRVCVSPQNSIVVRMCLLRELVYILCI